MMSNSLKFNHVLVINEPNGQKSFSLDSSLYTVGRHSGSNIRLNSGSVSRHHGTLIRSDVADDQYAYILIDGDLKGNRSQNGILVNGKKIIRRQLEDGDIILFGAEEIKGVYKIEQGVEEDSENTGVDENWRVRKSQRLAREELQNTLILSEENLSANLDDIDADGNEFKRLASFPELSPQPIIELDYDGNINYMNPSAYVCFGDLSKFDSYSHPLTTNLTIPKDTQNSQLVVREVQVCDRYFEQYIHYLSKYNVIRSYIFEITERKNSETKLQYQALHDSLTGIGNRDYFYRELNNRLREVQKNQESLAILFIDIDRFKNINDTLNHTTGDKLLEAFADRLLSCLPNNCCLARWGGDEFTLSISKITGNTVTEVIKIITEALKEPFSIEKYTIYITCSLGVAVYPQDGKTKEQLIQNADTALSRAKKMGKNNSQYYTTRLSEEQMLMFELETSLYNAIAHDELFLNYQPQLNLESGKIHSLESLVRWQHPQLGIVSPAKFIPLAEETGLIIEIGEWVLKTACTQMKKWLDLGYDLHTVAVNVSVKQFRKDNFVAKVQEILTSTNLDPKYLELEVTESILMEDGNKTGSMIKELSALGIKFSLDDFGTGYSSLSYLKKIPFHTIKIDQSFVRDLTINEEDKALIDAVITLAKGYRMKVVAEGVETEAQLKVLKDFHCDIIQGWWLSRPLMANDFTTFLEEFNGAVLH